MGYKEREIGDFAVATPLGKVPYKGQGVSDKYRKIDSKDNLLFTHITYTWSSVFAKQVKKIILVLEYYT